MSAEFVARSVRDVAHEGATAAEVLAQTLGKFGLFASLEKEKRLELCEKVTLQSYQPGEVPEDRVHILPTN